MPIADKMRDFIDRASWIRKMFEEGRQMKAQYGEKNVFDFSLGNPMLEPPAEFFEILREVAQDKTPGQHVYMPNPGFPKTRMAIADFVSKEQMTPVPWDNIVMTCGAAGALNVILKSILNPGEEVIVFAPYFVEYNFYVDNAGGKPILVPTKDDFSIDVSRLAPFLNPQTRAVLINSPNNPTGKIYSENNLKELARLLTQKSNEFGKPIYLISDEPYKKITYDDVQVPAIFPLYSNSFIATSYSKTLSLAGERIGYIAAHPAIADIKEIMDGLILCLRILGFVNAPALMQRVIAKIAASACDPAEYKRKRDLLCEGLSACGYQFYKPEGAFYLFPKSLIPDDVQFVRELQKERILTVPGSGFGAPGYFRIAYCVTDETITGSMAGFKTVAEKYR